MNVSLSPKLEAWINEKVASGMYRSANEVVRVGDISMILSRSID